jgi:hypothetical protein
MRLHSVLILDVVPIPVPMPVPMLIVLREVLAVAKVYFLVGIIYSHMLILETDQVPGLVNLHGNCVKELKTFT